jgi:two-component system phosphate regulon sensor histidine kinase PhoR
MGQWRNKVIQKYLKRAEKGGAVNLHRRGFGILDSKLEVGDLYLEYSEFDIVKLIQNVFDLLE